jgi:hypothetical protein
MSSESHYKIIKEGKGCRLLFSDQRLDNYYDEILSIFEIPIEGFYVPPRSIDEFNTGKPTKIIEWHDKIREKVEDCRHKVTAVRYGLALIQAEIGVGPSAETMRQYSEMIRHEMCAKAELMNEVLINETESFIFQTRSNLDIVVQLLKHLYPYLAEKGKDRESFKSDRRAGKTTADIMRDNGHEKMSLFFDAQIDSWIQNLNTLRNEIAHRSALKGFSCFVYESGGGRVIKPLMPDGTDLNEYCQDVYIKLLSLYKYMFEHFVVPEVKRISEEPYL